jgi:translation initiation factor IF-3
VVRKVGRQAKQLSVNRDYTLSTGLANLSDRVRVIDHNGMDLGYMIVAEAQRLAARQGGELSVIAREGQLAIVRVVLIKKSPSQ